MSSFNPPIRNSGAISHQTHDIENQDSNAPSQLHYRATKVELLRHQLRIQDSHITKLTQSVHRRDLAIAKLEAHLENARTETQAALRAVMLLSGLQGWPSSERASLPDLLNGLPSQHLAGSSIAEYQCEATKTMREQSEGRTYTEQSIGLAWERGDTDRIQEHSRKEGNSFHHAHT
jgi:hypothetical protein